MRGPIALCSFLLFSHFLAACSQKEALEPLSPQDAPRRSAASYPVVPPLIDRDTLGPPPGPKLDCAVPVVLTEVHVDPQRVSDRRGEFVEIHNPGKAPIDLTGWRLTDLGNDSYVIRGDPPPIVGPGQFFVLGSSADREANGGIPVDHEYTDFVLSNGGDRVRLEDPCGGVAFDLLYPLADGWPKLRAGASIERISPPGRPARWRRANHRTASGEKATPGFALWQSKRAKTTRPAGSKAARADPTAGSPTDSRRTAHRKAD